MTVPQISRTNVSADATRPGGLFFLELSGGRIHSTNSVRSDRKEIITDCRLPDGIVVEADAGHVYWTHINGTAAPEILITRLMEGIGTRWRESALRSTFPVIVCLSRT
jgi:hypothetical protein